MLPWENFEILTHKTYFLRSEPRIHSKTVLRKTPIYILQLPVMTEKFLSTSIDVAVSNNDNTNS